VSIFSVGFFSTYYTTAAGFFVDPPNHLVKTLCFFFFGSGFLGGLGTSYTLILASSEKDWAIMSNYIHFYSMVTTYF
jgi:hypothetical protein